ncbi:histone H1 isoform X2 [Rhododendron vialii]|uniref:histone H1 isoform X2 n=1 Tax=Rhododendron vialii TaxID=182163 RepID=UPI00265F5DAE|nr:histone H1 isoform X2 [Rhododendron vialii]XP_058198152.1 histone H1 isoform X2 [Rhododendron vialii]
MATEEPVVAVEPKAKKASKPRNPPLHPPYVEMVTDAIATLKDKSGSSQYAITKFIEEKQKQLPPNFKKLLLFHLKKLVASGKIVKVKASFKLPSVEKPKTATATATEVKKVPAKAKAVAAAKPKSVTKAKPAAKAKVAAKPKAVAKPKPKAKEKPAKVVRTSPGKKAAVSKPAPKKAAVKKVPAKSVKPKTVKSPGKKAGVKKGKKKAMKLMFDCSISQNVFGRVVFILLVLEESVAAAPSSKSPTRFNVGSGELNCSWIPCLVFFI